MYSYLPDGFDPEAFFKHAFGIFVDESMKPSVVQIRAFGNRRKYLQTLPLHHSQVENDSVFSYFLCPTEDFKQEILSCGADIEVLSPSWFRDDMMKTIKDLNGRYTESEKKFQ